jgi:hypothetical protein
LRSDRQCGNSAGRASLAPVNSEAESLKQIATARLPGRGRPPHPDRSALSLAISTALASGALPSQPK